MEPSRPISKRPFDESELAWFQRQGAVRRSETPARGVYVGTPPTAEQRSPWWQSLLDELDEA